MEFNLNQQRKLFREKIAYLEQHEACTAVSPEEFYRDLFPVGSFQQKGVPDDGRGNGIAIEIPGDGTVQRYTVTDDLKTLKRLRQADLAVMAPVSYSGKQRVSENARYLYAMTFNLDGVGMPQLRDFLHQCSHEMLPAPTYLVNSGTGLHLYYFFNAPVPMYPENQKYLNEIKIALTGRIWNSCTSTMERRQEQGISQAFRIVGGATKLGKARSYPVTAYRIGEGLRYDAEMLLAFIPDSNREQSRIRNLMESTSSMTLEEAKQAYPDWYERRVEKGEPRGTWKTNRALYDWWLRRIRVEIMPGHRYYGVMALAIYAKKCGIEEEELRQDAYSLLECYNGMTAGDTDLFTAEDIEAALRAYNDKYITFSRDEISRLTGLQIKKNKRNGRPMSEHVQYMNNQRAFKVAIGECTNGGRPSKKNIVLEWRRNHPEGSKVDCEKETGISRATVFKWWDSAESEEYQNKTKTELSGLQMDLS